MNLSDYNTYQDKKAKGLKKEAAIAISRFIQSFESDQERTEWTRQYLNDLTAEGKIRYELFEHVIFPVLLKGYCEEDLWSIFWLAKLRQNLIQARELHEKIKCQTEHDLLKKCLEIDPANEEIKSHLLERQISWFQYCEHEWPIGILYGVNGATLEECEKLRNEIKFARKFVGLEEDRMFLNKFEEKLDEYQERIAN